MQVRTSHPIVDAILDRYRREVGTALPAYRNHVLRSLNYHQLLLGEPVPGTAALAWAVHDLGIWTAGTWDYLDPSADLVSKHAAEFGIDDIEGTRRMVLDHHRLHATDDRLSETFRLADRIDATRGLLRRPATRADIEAVAAQLPYEGFHTFLIRRGVAYALTHPTRPLPMVRW
ncbi:hypothetical protein [Nocardia aurantia]|uniref:Phosphohydrolase n=1 Tax=Nocardia aurantia TaxID=2585199 RepID=A0A7K0E0V1_9NOCA|nr:hypothetical protein [Nocardia aurantia]MQY31438.1 hypothetical protein [Nocardia aurantia]